MLKDKEPPDKNKSHAYIIIVLFLGRGFYYARAESAIPYVPSYQETSTQIPELLFSWLDSKALKLRILFCKHGS